MYQTNYHYSVVAYKEINLLSHYVFLRLVQHYLLELHPIMGALSPHPTPTFSVIEEE
jgi:hypothetical protein